MKAMSNIFIKPIELKDMEAIQNFDCNNASMNNFLKQEAYYYHIAREASTSLVYLNSQLVAYFTLTRSELNIESDEFEEITHKTSLDLARLAVQKEYQKNGIGTYIIDEIKKIGYMINERFITTDALYEYWKWYKKRGFEYLIEDEIKSDNNRGLVYMIMDLYDERLLDEYFDEVV
jgi:GNAT superfamily N-acetyltransferase